MRCLSPRRFKVLRRKRFYHPTRNSWRFPLYQSPRMVSSMWLIKVSAHALSSPNNFRPTYIYFNFIAQDPFTFWHCNTICRVTIRTVNSKYHTPRQMSSMCSIVMASMSPQKIYHRARPDTLSSTRRTRASVSCPPSPTAPATRFNSYVTTATLSVPLRTLRIINQN